jgi:serine/threonine-protein kinase
VAASSVPSPAGAATPFILARRYRVERRLATGGMSEVWVATDAVLDRRVAIKLLKPALAADPIVVERLRREAVAAARLNHPGIVSVYDTVQDGGRQGVVMELIDGPSLRDVLDERHELRVIDTVAIGRAVAAALQAAHRAGLVHRDVKPGNILITDDGRVKLADFGIAKAIAARDDLTADNVMMGTAKYLSPEQVLGRTVDGRADLYSLGLVLYECLAGKVPFVGENDAATAVARIHDDPVPLRSIRPDVPQPVADVVHALLARDPEQRPADGATARAMLGQALTSRDRREPVELDVTGDPLLRRRDETPQSPIDGIPAPRPPFTTRPQRATPPGRSGAGPAAGGPDGGGTARPEGARRWPLIAVIAIAVATIVAGLVFASTSDDPGSETPPSTIAVSTVPGALPTLGPGGAGGASTAVDPADPAAIGVAEIRGVAEFDPLPGDGRENASQLDRLVDGDPTTAWTTVCYESNYLYPKPGVGVVIELDRPAAGSELRIAWPAAPWRVQVYAADDPGPALSDWGDPVAERGAETPGNASFSLAGASGDHLLIWLTQLPEGDGCGEQNPYRGQIGEVTLVAA